MRPLNVRNIFLLLITISSGTILAYVEADLEVPDISFDTFTLDNGLTVIVHTDHKVPRIAL